MSLLESYVGLVKTIKEELGPYRGWQPQLATLAIFADCLGDMRLDFKEKVVRTVLKLRQLPTYHSGWNWRWIVRVEHFSKDPVHYGFGFWPANLDLCTFALRPESFAIPPRLWTAHGPLRVHLLARNPARVFRSLSKDQAQQLVSNHYIGYYCMSQYDWNCRYDAGYVAAPRLPWVQEEMDRLLTKLLASKALIAKPQSFHLTTRVLYKDGTKYVDVTKDRKV